jgi:hypothetical protein
MEALSQSWKSITRHIWIFAGFTLVYFFLSSVLSNIPVVSFFASLLGFVYPVSVFCGLRAVDQYASVSFNDLFDWLPRFGRLLLGYLLLLFSVVLLLIPLVFVGAYLAGGFEVLADIMNGYEDFSLEVVLMLIGLGLVLFIPVLILQFSYLFLLCFQDHSVGYALVLSWKIGVANFGSLLLFTLSSIGIALLGVLALVIGLLVAVPLIIGMQYYFLRSIYPEQPAEEEWDFMKQSR